MKDNVSYIEASTIFPMQTKSTSFDSNKFSINNNEGVNVTLSAMASSSINARAKVQGTIDGDTWFTLQGTEMLINQDDDILWTLSQLQSLIHIKVIVTISSGSSIFLIKARGV